MCGWSVYNPANNEEKNSKRRGNAYDLY